MDVQLHADIVRYYTRCDKKYPHEIYCLQSGKLRSNDKSKFRQVAKPTVCVMPL